jgi:CubicO group peptidase (beta-lactamase class C family)
MNRGVLDGARILPDSAFTAMWKPTEALGEVAAGTHVTSEGISWYLGTYRRHFLLTHSGGDLGFITDLAMLPTEKIAVIWMANCDWIDAGPLNGPITYAALDAALGLKPQPITLKRSLARTLQFTYQQEGIDSALREYRLLKDRDDGLFDFSEKELAQFGRYLHTVGQDEAALSVLQINAASFPESLDARRDLADAQLRIKR